MAALQVAAYDAMHRGAWQDAVDTWTILRQRGGDIAASYVGAAEALLHAGRQEEADLLLREAVSRCRYSSGVAIMYARIATNRGDWASALPRWHAVRRDHPDESSGYLGEGIALLNAGSVVEADEVLTAGYSRFPANVEMALSWARAAQRAGKSEEAVLRWSHLVEQFPARTESYGGAGAALLTIGQYEKARVVLAAGSERFPDDANIAVYHAYASMVARPGDFSLAERWEEVLRRFPHHQLVAAHLGTRPPTPKEPQSMPPTAADGSAPLSDEAVRSLVLRFESLGSNCEFGMVQRRFEAEPLGLLRWVATFPDTLLALLDSGFAGIGAAENTTLIADISGEYLVRDLRFNVDMHTFQRVGQVDPELLLNKERRRLDFLARKLRRDLTEAEKVFVYWRPDLAPDTARALHAALRRHGPNRLLGIRLPRDDWPAGSIEQIHEGLLIGSIARDGRIGDRLGWDIGFDTWIDVFRRAIAILDQGCAPQVRDTERDYATISQIEEPGLRR